MRYGKMQGPAWIYLGIAVAFALGVLGVLSLLA